MTLGYAVWALVCCRRQWGLRVVKRRGIRNGSDYVVLVVMADMHKDLAQTAGAGLATSGRGTTFRWALHLQGH